MKYTYIYFTNEKDFTTATNNIYEFKQRQLEWSTPEEKYCHHCGYTNYIVKDCENTFVNNQKQINHKQLLVQYK